MEYNEVVEGIRKLELRFVDTLVIEVPKMSTDWKRVADALLMESSLCLKKIDVVVKSDLGSEFSLSIKNNK